MTGPSCGVWRGACVAECREEFALRENPVVDLFPSATNFARNSLATASNIELWSLELQRFWMLLNVHAVELRASFVWLWLWRGCCRPIGGLRAGRRCGCATRSPLAACRRRVGHSWRAISPSRSPPAFPHAIPLNNLVRLYQYVSSCHLCFGIACDFV